MSDGGSNSQREASESVASSRLFSENWPSERIPAHEREQMGLARSLTVLLEDIRFVIGPDRNTFDVAPAYRDDPLRRGQTSAYHSSVSSSNMGPPLEEVTAENVALLRERVEITRHELERLDEFYRANREVAAKMIPPNAEQFFPPGSNPAPLTSSSSNVAVGADEASLSPSIPARTPPLNRTVLQSASAPVPSPAPPLRRSGASSLRSLASLALVDGSGPSLSAHSLDASSELLHVGTHVDVANFLKPTPAALESLASPSDINSHLPILCSMRAVHARDHKARTCALAHPRYCSRCFLQCPVCQL